MTATAKAYLYVVLGVALLVGGVAGYKAIRASGASGVLLHQADSTHAVAVTTNTRDSLVAVTKVLAARDSAARTSAAIAKAQALVAASEAARQRAEASADSARQVLADSLATLADLRTTLTDVLATSQQLMEVDSTQFAADSAALLSARHTITAQATAIEAGATAYRASLARAVAAETETAILRKQAPSTFGIILRDVAVAAVAFTAGQHIK